MKKIILFFNVCCLALILPHNINAQSTCASAISITPNTLCTLQDYLIPGSDTATWFVFTADSQRVFIDIEEPVLPADTPMAHVHTVALYGGTCSSLTLLGLRDIDNGDSVFSQIAILKMDCGNLTIGQTYYIRVTRRTPANCAQSLCTNVSSYFSLCVQNLSSVVTACFWPGTYPCGELIGNGSFEYIDPTWNGGCPFDYRQPNEQEVACPWEDMPAIINNTFSFSHPDYFNICTNTTPANVNCNVCIPTNGFGTQAPRTGNGYAGLVGAEILMPTYANYYEGILQNNPPLTAGRVYYEEMYVSLSEISNIASSIGFMFWPGNTSDHFVAPITDIANWTHVSHCFTANGTESNFTITGLSSPIAPVNVTPSSTVYNFSNPQYPTAYYYVEDISLRPLAEAGPSITTCLLNATIGCTALPPIIGATYSWSVAGPGGVTFASSTSQSTNVTFTTAGTYTFTITTTVTTPAGTCSDTDVMTVTVNAFTSVINASSSSTCLGGSVNLSVTNTPATGTFTYAWGPPASGLSSSTINNPVATPTATTTYVVLVNNTATGCYAIASTTVTVDPTCCSGIYTVPTGGANASTFGTSFSATTLALNGNFIIDANTSITNNSIVLCSPNVKIIVQSGNTLIINRSSLYSCGTQMWDGIEIQPGGNLIIENNSLVEDAKIAVYSDNTGTIANFRIENTIFNRNYIAVKIFNHTSASLHPGIIRSTIFNSAASTTSTINTVFLDSPYNTQTAEKGVYLLSVNSMQIGDPALPAYQNEFIYLRVGIHADNSVYTAYNNFFHNNFPTPGCTPPFPPPPNYSCPVIGWAIWNNKTKAVIGGPASGQPNRFQDITNGILHENGSYLDAFNNTFLNMIYTFPYDGGTAILTRNFLPAGAIRIENNDIRNVKTGLHHYNNNLTSYDVKNNLFKNFSSRGIYCVQNTNGGINIFTNDFNQSPTSVFSGNIGIEVGSAVTPLSSSPLVNIDNNTIFRTNKGVLLTNMQKPQVTYNMVVFKSNITPISNFYYGIRSLNGNSETIFQNTVNKSGPNPTAVFENAVYGISVEGNAALTYVAENYTAKIGTGLRFRGYSNANSTVRCNIMYRDFAGLALDAVAIGQQGQPVSGTYPLGIASDNNWTNPSFVSGSVAVRGSGSFVPPDMYTRSATYPWCPLLVNVSPGNTIHTANSTIPLVGGVVGSAPTSCSNICYSVPCVPHSMLAKIARNESPFNAETGTKRYMMHEGILRGVLADSIPPDTTTADGLDLQTFIDTMLANSNIGKLVSVGMLYAGGDTSGAIVLNGSVATTSCADEYHKIVNNIFFNSWGMGSFYFSSADSLTLYNIAIQDPLNCGTAIYDARVMLGMDINDFTMSASRSTEISSEEGNAVEDMIGILYPNPAQNSCIYEANLSDTANGLLIMYDLNGKFLSSFRLFGGYNNIEIDLSDYSNGIYLYKIIINGEIVDNKKLVIAK